MRSTSTPQENSDVSSLTEFPTRIWIKGSHHKGIAHSHPCGCGTTSSSSSLHLLPLSSTSSLLMSLLWPPAPSPLCPRPPLAPVGASATLPHRWAPPSSSTTSMSRRTLPPPEKPTILTQAAAAVSHRLPLRRALSLISPLLPPLLRHTSPPIHDPDPLCAPHIHFLFLVSTLARYGKKMNGPNGVQIMGLVSKFSKTF
jgi:hypothetical protein